MKLLFLSLLDFSDIYSRNIYTDVLRQFINNGHNVTIISPVERRCRKSTHIINETGYRIFKPRIGNIQKTGFVEKGISTIMLEWLILRGIKRYLANERYDLVLYATPPITFQKVISYIKKRDGAKTYLLLKDIWPQGIVDMQILSKSGIRGLIYRYFRTKERRLYRCSDIIGCMSKANVDYLLRNNPEISPDKVEICPNSIEPEEIRKDAEGIKQIREQYGIPLERTVFVYGGNLGKPQGIDFIIDCLRANKYNNQVYFIIAGSGTEYSKLYNAIKADELNNTRLFEQLPKDEYERLLTACDVGLIFLDYRFTIPNFPSRLLSYMQASMPVLAATDIHTDMGQVIEEGGFGYWCESRDIDTFNKKLSLLCNRELRLSLSLNSRRYLETHYTAKNAYKIIIKHFI